MIQSVKIAWQQVRAIFLGLVALMLLSAWRGKWPLVFLFGILWFWVCTFFRDPDRVPEDDGAEAILAPADGRVQKIEIVHEPQLFKGQARRITIFLSIFNVHVQRMPYGGKVIMTKYTPGSFAPAFSHHADENESTFIGVMTEQGPLAVVQLSGILARRIIWHCSVGEQLERGERYGLIRFGSRVDLYLPLEANVLAQEGDSVVGGETVVARWAFDGG